MWELYDSQYNPITNPDTVAFVVEKLTKMGFTGGSFQVNL